MQEMQEMNVWSPGQEDILEKEMATHSSILAWKIPRTEESGGLLSMGLQKVRHDWVTEHTHILYISVYILSFNVSIWKNTGIHVIFTCLKIKYEGTANYQFICIIIVSLSK